MTDTSVNRHLELVPFSTPFIWFYILRRTLLLDGHFVPVATKVSVLERVCIYFLCEIVRPRPHVSFSIWKRRVLLTDGNSHWKSIFSKNALRSGDFWKRRCAVLVRMDENWGFEDDYVTLLNSVYPVHEIRQIRLRYQYMRMLQSKMVPFSVTIHGQKRFKNETCGRGFLRKRRKNSSF